MIIVENKNGIISFDEIEIVMFIEEQIKLVPGVLFFRKSSLAKVLREKLGLSTGKVSVRQINPGEVFITVKIYMNDGISFRNVEEEIHNLLNYSLMKKYGLSISNLEIIVENLI